MSSREEYQRYLCSPEWWAKRNAVMERADYKCERCCREARHVHHLTYIRKFHERLDDLIALCEECHSEIHNPPRDIAPTASSMTAEEYRESIRRAERKRVGLLDEWEAARNRSKALRESAGSLRDTLTEDEKQSLREFYELRQRSWAIEKEQSSRPLSK